MRIREDGNRIGNRTGNQRGKQTSRSDGRRALAALCAAALLLAGCGEETGSGDRGVESASGTSGDLAAGGSSFMGGFAAWDAPVSEDAPLGDPCREFLNPIMRTENGYYYSMANQQMENGCTMGIHYFDVRNGNAMFLCNKPECRHEGDDYCTATSAEYYVRNTVLYGGSLYLSAVRARESQTDYVLLRASLDGGQLGEVVTWKSFDHVNAIAADLPETGRMAIHRNKAFLPYDIFPLEGEWETSGIHGCAVCDLASGKLELLPELENVGRGISHYGCFSGAGDAMYFVRTVGRDDALCRYRYEDGSVEELETEGYFGGYALMDENTLFYISGKHRIYRMDLGTGESTEVVPRLTTMVQLPSFAQGEDGEWVETGELVEVEVPSNDELSSLISDGEILYASVSFDFRCSDSVGGGGGFRPDGTGMMAKVYAFDRDGTKIGETVLWMDDLFGGNESFGLHFLGETIYLQSPGLVQRCTRESFLAGSPVWEEAYRPEDCPMWSLQSR